MMNDALIRSYVRRWFLTLDELAARSGGELTDIEVLTDARAAPGPIYIYDGQAWWSPLTGEPAPFDGEKWYTAAAAYWLRRALVALRDGATAEEAARENLAAFTAQFTKALEDQPMAEGAFGDVIISGKIDPIAAEARAAREWQDWIDGGYGVCLRSFTGQSCVTKETLGHYLREQEPDPARSAELLDLIEPLSAAMLPFAPHQRAAATPGKTVDRLLSAMQLGDEQPYLGLE